MIKNIPTSTHICSDGIPHLPAAGSAAHTVTKTSASATPAAPPHRADPSPNPQTKRALVLTLLRREEGATLPELMAATGWQVHSVRAVLTGLRKSGLVLEKSTRAGATCYQTMEAGNA